MKSLIIIFGALLLIIATPFVFDAIDDTRAIAVEESFAGVTTAAGVHSTNITLGRAIFNDDATSITEITSNVTADVPTVSTFNSTTRIANVGGLEENEARLLSVEYKIDRPSLPDGMSTFLLIVRWFYIFIILGMSAGAIYAFFD